MKPKQNNILDFQLKDYCFILTPLSIKSDKPISGIHLLDLQKGCQNIACLQESIKFNNNNTYTFSNRLGVSVKAFKQKGMNFSWSLYKNCDSYLEHIDTFKVNILDYFNEYIQQLKNHQFQYSRIYQQKLSYQKISQSWNRLKTHLKKYKVNAELKNARKDFTLLCIIEIKSQLDILSQKQLQRQSKVKIEKKCSHESDIKSASSSRNSLRQKSKIDTSNIQKTLQKQLELNIESTIKYQISNQNDEIKLNVNFAKGQGKNHIQQNEREKDEIIEKVPTLTINPPRQRQRQTLSDIIEVSNQQSHQVGQKTERNMNEQASLNINPTPQMSFAKTKTFHFQNSQNSKDYQLKRNNSLQSPKRISKIDDQQECQLAIPPKNVEVVEEDLTQQSTIIKNENNNTKINEINKNNNISQVKYILLILLVYGLIIGLFMNSPFKINMKRAIIKGDKLIKTKIDKKLFLSRK